MKSCPYYPEVIHCPEELNDMVKRNKKRVEDFSKDRAEYNADPLPKGCRKIRTGDELAQYFIDNSDEFIMRGLFIYMFGRDDWKRIRSAQRRGAEVIFPKITYLSFFRMAWKESVSNTHNCPRNGIENFMLDEDLPKGYPGWRGRLTIKFSADRVLIRQAKGSKKEFRTVRNVVHASSIFCEETGIRTGSGGGNHQSLSYDVSLFASDFPEMVNMIEDAWVENKIDEQAIQLEKDLTWAGISDNSPHPIHRKQCRLEQEKIQIRNSVADSFE